MNIDWSMVLSAAVIAGLLPISILSLTAMLARRERLSPHAESDAQVRRRFSDAAGLREFQRRVDAERLRCRDAVIESYVEAYEGHFGQLDPREVPAYRDALSRTLAAIAHRAPPGAGGEPDGPGDGNSPPPDAEPAVLLARLMPDRTDGSQRT